MGSQTNVSLSSVSLSMSSPVSYIKSTQSTTTSEMLNLIRLILFSLFGKKGYAFVDWKSPLSVGSYLALSIHARMDAIGDVRSPLLDIL